MPNPNQPVLFAWLHSTCGLSIDKKLLSHSPHKCMKRFYHVLEGLTDMFYTFSDQQELTVMETL